MSNFYLGKRLSTSDKWIDVLVEKKHRQNSCSQWTIITRQSIMIRMSEKTTEGQLIVIISDSLAKV